MGKKEGLTETIVDLEIVDVVADHGLGRFGLHPTQMVPKNVYLPLALIQQAYTTNVLKNKSDNRQANIIFLEERNRLPRKPNRSNYRRPFDLASRIWIFVLNA